MDVVFFQIPGEAPYKYREPVQLPISPPYAMFTNVSDTDRNLCETDALAPANIDVEAIRKKVSEIRMHQSNA